jgi:hypothetical protein
MTPDELRDEHVSKLGPKLGPVYHALWKDVAWLNVTWHEYHEMFGTTPKRIDLLNSAAGLFFRIVQDLLWEQTLLHLSRLTDPPRSVGKNNLTLRALPELIDDPVLRSKVAALVDRAVHATNFARDWRNREISHRDLDLALERPAQPLAPSSRNHVSDALTAIHAVLNHISEELLQSSLAPDVITPLTGAVALLNVIRYGIEAKEARAERLQKGQPLPGDLGPHPL